MTATLSASLLLSYAIVCILGLWLIATILDHLPVKLREFIGNELISSLIPSWNFFAPIPGTHDYRLLYRDQLEDGSIGVWKELTFADERNFLSFLWNPNKRGKKALFDLTTTLAQMIINSDAAPDLVKISIPYLTLLNFISNVPRSKLSTATQFLLMESSMSEKEPSIIFLSGLHTLE